MTKGVTPIDDNIYMRNNNNNKVTTMKLQDKQKQARECFKMVWLIKNLAGYDNDNHNDEFRQAVRDAIKALRNLRKFF